VNLSLATSEVYYDKENVKREITEWHNVVMWRGLAETAERYLKKGDQVYIEGRIRTRSWEDKETQQKRYIVEIQADNMQMLGGNRSSNGQANGADALVAAIDDEGDGLPF
jgi:single-strand DNA-binding protein